MIARLAYLTSPAPNVFILNYQVEGEEIARVEISKAHLANILIDGLSLSLRESSVSHRVPVNQTTESAHEHHGSDHRP